MKKFKKIAILACAFSAFAFFACKSTPEAQPAPVEDFSESNNALLEKIEARRKEAMEAGAESKSSAAFALAETGYNAAKDAVLVTTVDLTKEFEALAESYEALTIVSGAVDVKAEIDELGIAEYAQEDYDAGCAILKEFDEAGKDFSVEQIAEDVEAASLLEKIVTNDWKQKAVEAKAYFDNALSVAKEKAEADRLAKEQAEAASRIKAANMAALEKVEATRKALIASGADKKAETAFAIADKEYEAAKAAMEADPLADVSAAFNDVNTRYGTVAAIAEAIEAKAKVDEAGFASYDQVSYDRGSAILDEVVDPVKFALLGSSEIVSKKAAAAKVYFEKTLDAGYRTLAKNARAEAFAAKKDADSVKASVSRKAEYDAAVTAFNAGDSKFVTKDPAGSINSYTSAKESFTKLYEEISVARARAQAAIDAAKKRVALSEGTATSADAEAPLGEGKIEGIEAEDAKLLEEDDFTAAENSVVELEAELEVEEETVEVEEDLTPVEKAVDSLVDALEETVTEAVVVPEAEDAK